MYVAGYIQNERNDDVEYSFVVIIYIYIFRSRYIQGNRIQEYIYIDM